MRYDVKDPTTPEEWARSRCQESDRAGRWSALRHCEDKATRRCDACGKLTCAVHWRHHGWATDAPELCLTCWEARADERAAELARMRVLTPEEVAAEAKAQAAKARRFGLLERLRKAWSRKGDLADDET